MHAALMKLKLHIYCINIGKIYRKCEYSKNLYFIERAGFSFKIIALNRMIMMSTYNLYPSN